MYDKETDRFCVGCGKSMCDGCELIAVAMLGENNDDKENEEDVRMA